jgi:NADH dehydrogenase FAD-containing subunit
MAPRLLRAASLCASLLLGLSTPVQAVPFSRRAQTSKGLQTEHCDVAVVGGGAGGANTAVFLKDKVRKEPMLD